MATATAEIHFRISLETKTLLTLAAELSGASNLTDYILRAAVERAQSDLSSKHFFALKKCQCEEFTEQLDAPARNLPQLRKLLTKLDVFDRTSASAGAHRCAASGGRVRLRRNGAE